MFSAKKFIARLVSFSPRQVEGETKTLHYLLSVLKKNRRPFIVQNFTSTVPLTMEAILSADGENIDCEGCSFKSGTFDKKSLIISSLQPSANHKKIPNLNFNPACRGISLKNNYFAPALALNARDIDKLKKAKVIKGKVQVKKISRRSANILIGNPTAPRRVIFAHYDGLKKGAIDNASGVAIAMRLLIENPEIMKKNLIVLAGSEELSYDQPVYWGRGYREFEKKYPSLLERAEEIIILDSLGHSPLEIITDPSILKLAFPVRRLADIQDKLEVLSGNMEKLMQVYHSDLDDGRHIKKKYLDEAYLYLLKKFKIKKGRSLQN